MASPKRCSRRPPVPSQPSRVAPPVVPVAGPETVEAGVGVDLIRSDLNFILNQIKIAEAQTAGADILDLIPNVRAPLGLRTVDGSFNNLMPGQDHFGAADNVFPRLSDPQFNASGRWHVLPADQRLGHQLAASHDLQPDRRSDRQQSRRLCHRL